MIELLSQIYAALVITILILIETRILRRQASGKDFGGALYLATISFMVSNVFFAISDRMPIEGRCVAVNPAAYLTSFTGLLSIAVAAHYVFMERMRESGGD